jgi:hypothetical protein
LSPKLLLSSVVLTWNTWLDVLWLVFVIEFQKWDAFEYSIMKTKTEIMFPFVRICPHLIIFYIYLHCP